MTVTYTWGPAATELNLTEWDFEHLGSGATPVRVSVPHSALREVSDVTAGGEARYGLTIDVDQPRGDEELFLDAVGVDPRVYVNGELASDSIGIWSPVQVPLQGLLQQGDNRIDVVVALPDYDPESPRHFRKLLLGFVPDVAGPFAGIWQAARLQRRAPVTVDHAVDHAARALRISWEGLTPGETLRVEATGRDGQIWQLRTDEAAGTANLECDGAVVWSPEEPQLVRLRIWTDGPDGATPVADDSVGFRELTSSGDRITLSGEPRFLKGILHWGYYPDTGLPGLPPAEARAELEAIREMGFNCVKFCLFMPPQHVLDACDELGLLVWQELPLWLPRDMEQTSARMAYEYPQLLRALRRHPSVVVVSLGCELEADVPTTLLDEHYDAARAVLPDAVICSNSGSGEAFGGGIAAESDLYDYHFYGDVQQLRGLFARFTQAPREVRPWIFGEYNDFDTWRRVGPEQEPRWWTSQSFAVNPLRSVHRGFGSDQPVYRQAEIIAEQGYGDELGGLEALSLVQGHAARKLILEHSRTYPAIGGYVLTVLRDTPITTAGLTDHSGLPKWEPATVAALNAPVLLTLASPPSRRWHRGGDRLVLTDPYNLPSGGSHSVTVGVSNTTRAAGSARVALRLDVAGTVTETFADVCLDAFHTGDLAELRLDVPDVGAITQRARLSATLTVAGGAAAANEWDVLVHPAPTTAPEVVLLDPAGGLDQLARVWGVTPHRSWEAALPHLHPGARLLTTTYRADLFDEMSRLRLKVFTTTPGDVFEPMPRPFWREAVTRVHDVAWLRAAHPTEHVTTSAMAVASDRVVTRAEIARVTPDWDPLITRYDARSYVAGQYLFEWSRDGAEHTVCTLSLGGGVGIQPQFVAENLLGTRILDAWMGK